jgi:hypothetical protein
VAPIERAAYLLSLGAVILAWLLARRRLAHRPVALLLMIGLAGDAFRRALRVAVLAPARAALAGAPYMGAPRLAFHAEQALFLAWLASLVAAAIQTFAAESAKPRRGLILAIWAATVLTLTLTYPATRGPVLARCYLAAELTAILISGAAIVNWVPRRRSPELHHLAIALVVAAECVSALAGPWRTNLFGSWPLAQVVYAALFGSLIVLQGGALWLMSSE